MEFIFVYLLDSISIITRDININNLNIVRCYPAAKNMLNGKLYKGIC